MHALHYVSLVMHAPQHVLLMHFITYHHMQPSILQMACKHKEPNPSLIIVSTTLIIVPTTFSGWYIVNFIIVINSYL
jgi:hypothetical protein